MVKVKEDLTGKIFGRLTVIKQVEDYVSPKGEHRAKWLCKCSCEDEFIEATGHDLKNKHTQSCGCLRKETASNFLKMLSKKYNDYEIQEDYVIMYTQKGESFLVDLEDFWKVKDICWSKTKEGYIIGYKDAKIVKLHRLIMNPSDGMNIDHRNHDKTDNRKSNLRIATASQNNMNVSPRKNNVSGITGISWKESNKKWQVTINANKKHFYLGLFADINEAIRVRKEAEKKYFGEWSYENSMKSNLIVGGESDG